MATAPRRRGWRTTDALSRKERMQWYNRWDWRGPGGYREQQLQRQPLCEECLKNDIVEPATDVDHIEPFNGREELFTDLRNLRSLCHSCHSRKTASQQDQRERSA